MYRIYTENLARSTGVVLNLLADLGIPGATLLHGTGLWKGLQEPCLVIEITGDETRRPIIEDFVHILRQALSQEAVLIVYTPGEETLITAT